MENFKVISNLLLNGPHDSIYNLRLNKDVQKLLFPIAKQLNCRGLAELIRTAIDLFIDACEPCPKCGLPALDKRTFNFQVPSVMYKCPNCGKEFEIVIDKGKN